MTSIDSRSVADVVIVGSGTCGATLARDLSRNGHSVVLLEKGARVPLRENAFSIGSMADEVPVADRLKAIRAVAAGGSTSLYFAVAERPPVDAFLELGIDLTREASEVCRDLPLDELPDDLLGPQALRLRDSAGDLGLDFKKNLMLIDQSKCKSGYGYEAKWKALSYVDEAIEAGTRFIPRASVTRVLTDGNRAIGVEYKQMLGAFPARSRRIMARKVVVCAGSLATAGILLRSGLAETGKAGFFVDPGFAVFGLVPNLGARNNFVGSMSTDFEDDTSFGDGNMPRSLQTLFMVGNGKLQHAISFQNTIGIGVKIKDEVCGSVSAAGIFHKSLTREDARKLKQGEEKAVRILKRAGAKSIFTGKTVAANPGGVFPIGSMLDETLQTRIRDLHVCDASVLPAHARVVPTLTLVCLAKFMARRIHETFAQGR